MGKWAVVVVLMVALLSWAAVVRGDVPRTFSMSGSGDGGEAISAQVDFSFTTHDFGSGAVDAVRIDLTNTAADTSYRANLITGVFWSLDAEPDSLLPTAASGFDGLAPTVVSLLSDGKANTDDPVVVVGTNVDLGPAVDGTATDGMYQLVNLYAQSDKVANSGVDYSAYEYGIATVGYGLGGLNGQDLDTDNYGIAALGSNLNEDGLPSAVPVISHAASFWIARPTWWTSLEQIGSAPRVTYGSLPNFYLTSVPEPSSGLLAGLLAVAGLACRRRRRN